MSPSVAKKGDKVYVTVNLTEPLGESLGKTTLLVTPALASGAAHPGRELYGAGRR